MIAVCNYMGDELTAEKISGAFILYQSQTGGHISCCGGGGGEFHSRLIRSKYSLTTKKTCEFVWNGTAMLMYKRLHQSQQPHIWKNHQWFNAYFLNSITP